MTESLRPEQTGSVEELIALHNTLQRSFADPANPEASLAAQRSEFSNVIATAHQQPFDEQARAMINHYATVVEFLWFGGQADSLPAALSYFWAGYEAAEEWGDIGFNPEVFDTGQFNAITQTLMPLGLGALLQQRIGYAEQQKEQIETAFKTLVETTPAAQWFNAFKAEQANDDIPLPPLLRAGPEREIRERTAREVDPHNVRAIAGRRMTRLDEATVRRPRKHEDDARAFRLVQTHVDAYIEENVFTKRPASADYDREDGSLRTYTADGRLIDNIDIGEVAGDLFSYDNVPFERSHALHTLSREFYFGVLYRIYDGPGSHLGVQDELFATGPMRDFLSGILGGFNLVSGYDTVETLGFLKYVDPSRPFDVERLRNKGGTQLPSPFSKASQFRHNTKDEIENKRRKLIGKVEKYRNPTPDITRMLQSNFRTYNLPIRPSDTATVDLILVLENFEVYPHVHGYQLIAADRLQNRFWFTYDRDNDPYLPDKTRFPKEARRSLARSYADLGLRALAKNVRRQKALTVSKLAAHSRESSTFTFRDPAHPDFAPMLTSLESFSYFVGNNALLGTCDIYGVFGMLSLNVVLPEDQEAFVTEGLALPPEGESVSEVGHSQVAIKDLAAGVITSVTDWSPSVAGGLSSYVGPPRYDRRTITPPVVSARPEVIVPLTVAQQVTLATERLMMQLGVMFAPGVPGEIPADYIYTRVKRLGARHPATKRRLAPCCAQARRCRHQKNCRPQ